MTPDYTPALSTDEFLARFDDYMRDRVLRSYGPIEDMRADVAQGELFAPISEGREQ